MSFTRDRLLLYVVTDRTWIKDGTLLLQVEEVLKNGATLLQLREKNLAEEAFFAEACEMKKLAARYQVPLIINDSVEVCKRADADGVHVGQGDMTAAEARKILGPEKIIGVSARTVEQAKRAQEDGADYIGTGAVFPTATKMDANTISLAELKQITQSVSIPVVAIGGIHEGNIEQLKGTGVAGAAVVSAIFSKDDIGAATADLYQRVKRVVR